MYEDIPDEELIMRAQALDYLISTDGVENVRVVHVVKHKSICEELKRRGWEPRTTVVFSKN